MVDVNVKIINDRPSVYSITHLHEIIELPDDDDWAARQILTEFLS